MKIHNKYYDKNYFFGENKLEWETAYFRAG